MSHAQRLVQSLALTARVRTKFKPNVMSWLMMFKRRTPSLYDGTIISAYPESDLRKQPIPL